MATRERFDVSIKVRGSLHPGKPLQITASAVPLIASPGATLRITLPELAVSATSGAGPLRYPLGHRIVPALEQRLIGAPGKIETHQVSVQFAEPGFYRAVVTVVAAGDSTFAQEGAVVISHVVKELWLWIPETGEGEILDAFDADRILPKYRKVPGPLRDRATPARSASTESLDAGDERSAGGPSADFETAAPAPTPDLVTYHVKYYDALQFQYLPIDGASYSVRTCTKEWNQFYCPAEQFVEVDNGYTGSSGTIYIGCQGDDYEGDVSTFSASAGQVAGGGGYFSGSFSGDCGGDYDVIIGSNAAVIFQHLRTTYANTTSFFGEARSPIYVTTTTGTTQSHYDTGDDALVINTQDVYGSWGVFTVAHEYGHAFHAETLGGWTLGGCGNVHFIDTNSDLACAYFEGFADFFAAVTRPDSSYYSPSYFENDDAFPGCAARGSAPSYTCTGGSSTEGSIIEGAFAAFLYDLVDSGVEAHDSVSSSGTYVKELIQSCEVDYSNDFRRAEGTDEIIYCAQNSTGRGSHLQVRPANPLYYYEDATESGSWTQVRVANAWVWNLYDKQ